MNSHHMRTYIEALKSGELVAIPSETVYGLAANACDEGAVRKIFEVKGRPLIDPLIVHIASIEQAHELAYVPEVFFDKLVQAFWPGPLTLVLEHKGKLPSIVTAGLPTIALRMPKHPVFREILIDSKLPLAAPSANPFGYISPTQAGHVKRMLGDKVKYIIEGGGSDVGLESTILNLSDPQNPVILRPGPITREALESVLGEKVSFNKSKDDDVSPLAPGMLKEHYSPKTPLFLWGDEVVPFEKYNKVGLIYLERQVIKDLPVHVDVFWLSETGDLNEVAKNLFSLLQHLDQERYSALFTQLAPDEGLGLAINDRLKRAGRPFHLG